MATEVDKKVLGVRNVATSLSLPVDITGTVRPYGSMPIVDERIVMTVIQGTDGLPRGILT
jgi:hypothetical protein